MGKVQHGHPHTETSTTRDGNDDPTVLFIQKVPQKMLEKVPNSKVQLIMILLGNEFLLSLSLYILCVCVTDLFYVEDKWSDQRSVVLWADLPMASIKKRDQRPFFMVPARSINGSS